jgi:hypothetical protein
MFITIGVVLVVVFAVAIRMDLKRRHLGDTRPARSMGKSGRQARLEGRERSSESGAGL